jgi:hypothetical protein
LGFACAKGTPAVTRRNRPAIRRKQCGKGIRRKSPD